MSKILMLVEGSKSEPVFFEHCIKLLGIDSKNKIEIISYGTTIYHLYNQIIVELEKTAGKGNVKKLDELEDSINTRILYISFLEQKLRDLKCKNKKQANSDRKKEIEDIQKNIDTLSTVEFEDIFLIFDYDPHVTNFDKDKLLELLRLFNCSHNGKGKLYINYPAFESFKHIIWKCGFLWQQCFNRLSIDIKGKEKSKKLREKLKEYKKDTNKINKGSKINLNNIELIDENNLRHIIGMHDRKFQYLQKIMQRNSSVTSENEDIVIFTYIEQQHNQYSKIPVLNTSVRYFLEYL